MQITKVLSINEETKEMEYKILKIDPNFNFSDYYRKCIKKKLEEIVNGENTIHG